MNTGELATKVAKETGLGQSQARNAVTALLHTIQSEVRSGNKVTLAGFGSFTQTKRKARKGRNPKTGEPVKISAKRVPKFSAGRVFKELVSKERKLEKLAIAASAKPATPVKKKAAVKKVVKKAIKKSTKKVVKAATKKVAKTAPKSKLVKKPRVKAAAKKNKK